MKNKILILIIALFLTQIYLASALTITSVKTNPGEVQPGGKFTLELKIENNLNTDIKNVVVSLILSSAQETIPFAPYQSSSEYTIDEIENGEDEKASFDLIVFSDAVSGTYTIPVQVSYDNKSENLGVVTVIVNAKPKIDLRIKRSFERVKKLLTKKDEK